MNSEASNRSQEPSRGQPFELPDELIDKSTTSTWNGPERRRHPRVKFRRLITLRIPDDPEAQASDDSEECQVHARTLSNGGISFVYPSELSKKDLQIALDLLDGSVLWFDAEIVRSRPLEDGTGWEFGAAFRAITSFEC